LVDYHDFYLPVMTNMSKASHSYLSLLPCLDCLCSMTHNLHTSVQAKWTGSKIIKYGGNAFRLCTWLSVVPLIPATPPLPSPSKLLLLSSAHQSWDHIKVADEHVDPLGAPLPFHWDTDLQSVGMMVITSVMVWAPLTSSLSGLLVFFFFNLSLLCSFASFAILFHLLSSFTLGC